MITAEVLLIVLTVGALAAFLLPVVKGTSDEVRQRDPMGTPGRRR